MTARKAIDQLTGWRSRLLAHQRYSISFLTLGLSVLGPSYVSAQVQFNGFVGATFTGPFLDSPPGAGQAGQFEIANGPAFGVAVGVVIAPSSFQNRLVVGGGVLFKPPQSATVGFATDQVSTYVIYGSLQWHQPLGARVIGVIQGGVARVSYRFDRLDNIPTSGDYSGSSIGGVFGAGLRYRITSSVDAGLGVSTILHRYSSQWLAEVNEARSINGEPPVETPLNHLTTLALTFTVSP